ncbi:hypothetical protein TFLX_05260 [Thermoflexales bacterium]|nr:hypothetical protein TFLX_05260 [Thermoflexales bacterium]
MRFKLMLLIVAAVVLAACAAPTPTPRPIGPTATERPFPTFGPTRTPKPTRTPRPTQTRPATATVLPAPPTETTATISTTRPASSGTLRAIGTGKPAAAPTGPLARTEVPALLRSALIKAGVTDPRVYWFTFDEGNREQALMVQYASPLRWQTGYNEMLRAAKQTLGRYYLQIDPPLYTAFVVATDLTGTSDVVQRLRRFAPEKLAQGEIGEEDFLNNYFEPAPVTITCAADSTCTGKMATPFPVFHFPFPFPTPTP